MAQKNKDDEESEHIYKKRGYSWMDPPLYWDGMTQEECVAHFNRIGERLQEHRYRYYFLNTNIISDQEYDYIERLYEKMAKTLGIEPIAVLMVGFDVTKPGAKEAKERVDSGQDGHSMWMLQFKSDNTK